jgi:hypothetical protein
VVLGGSAAVLAWGIIPVVASATDMTLDPARFTTFAIPMKQLLAGLALGGLIGIPGVATSLVSLSTVVTWSRGVLPALAALLGAALGVMTCVVLAKVVTTATASLAASRHRVYGAAGPDGSDRGGGWPGDLRFHGLPAGLRPGIVLDSAWSTLVPGR